MKKKPIEKFPYGRVCASIWSYPRKDQPDKQTYSITIDRSYRDGEDWKHTNSFYVNDLPDVIAAADDAYKYLRSRKSTAADMDIANDEVVPPSEEQ